MIPGTTPTLTLRLKRSAPIDFTSAQRFYVTLKQDKVVLTKQGNDVVPLDTKTVQVILTQAETLQFSQKNKVEIQLNWLYQKDGETRRAASRPIEVELDQQLLQEVLALT